MVANRDRTFGRVKKDSDLNRPWTAVLFYKGLPMWLRRFNDWKEALEWTAKQTDTTRATK